MISTNRLSAVLAAAVLAVATVSHAAIPTLSNINTYYTTAVASDALDNGAAWDVLQSASNGAGNPIDATATFGFDYVAGGTFGIAGAQITLAGGAIPASPGGSTRGLVMTANDFDNTGTDLAQGVAARLIGSVALGGRTSWAVRFDHWGNFAGTSSTSEFPFWGVNGNATQTSIGTLTTGATGTGTLPPPGGLASAGVGPIVGGYTFTTTVDGGFGRDLRAYVGTAEEIVDTNFIVKSTVDGSGNLAIAAQDGGHPGYSSIFGSPQHPGLKWLDVIMYYDGTDLSYMINGQVIYSKAVAGMTPDQAFLGYMDANSSVSAPAALTFGVYDNFRILVPEPTTLTALAGLSLFAKRRRT